METTSFKGNEDSSSGDSSSGDSFSGDSSLGDSSLGESSPRENPTSAQRLQMVEMITNYSLPFNQIPNEDTKKSPGDAQQRQGGGKRPREDAKTSVEQNAAATGEDSEEETSKRATSNVKLTPRDLRDPRGVSGEFTQQQTLVELDLGDLKRKVEDMIARLGQMEKVHAAAQEKKQAEITALTEEKRKLTKELSVLSAAQEKNQAEITALTEEKRKLTKELSVLSAAQKRNQAEILALTVEKRKLTRALSMLSDFHKGMKHDLESKLQALQENYGGETSALHAQIKSLEDTKHDLESKLQALQEKYGGETSALHAQIKSLEERNRILYMRVLEKSELFGFEVPTDVIYSSGDEEPTAAVKKEGTAAANEEGTAAVKKEGTAAVKKEGTAAANEEESPKELKDDSLEW